MGFWADTKLGGIGMFEVRDKRSGNVYTVYAVETRPLSIPGPRVVCFLMFFTDKWLWMNANCYIPVSDEKKNRERAIAEFWAQEYQQEPVMLDSNEFESHRKDKL